MKYENFKQIKNLVEQIESHQRNLDLLEGDNTVIIEYAQGFRIYTIGTSKTCEHEYQYQAEWFIEYIRTDLKKRINNLKSMLELL